MECLKATMNPYNIYMPPWVKPRLTGGWQYTGVIVERPGLTPLKEMVARALRSDHGEAREVDYYEQGVACWLREPAKKKGERE